MIKSSEHGNAFAFGMRLLRLAAAVLALSWAFADDVRAGETSETVLTRASFPVTVDEHTHTFTYECDADRRLDSPELSGDLLDRGLRWCSDKGVGDPSSCAEALVARARLHLSSARGEAGTPPHGQHGLTPAFFDTVSAIFKPEFGTVRSGRLRNRNSCWPSRSF